jgi:N-methylhydantoinase A
MNLLGVDVGGTFTDLVLTETDSGSVHVHKVPTSGEDPSEGVMKGVGEICEIAGVDPGSVAYIFHGTTTATNAMLEHRGAEVGLITTEGFRDVLHIARHQRPQHYSIMQEIPWQDRALVKRRHRKVVSERIKPPRGEVLKPLDEEAVRRAARELHEAGVDSVAVCFLFSYLNPDHEERAREIVEEEFPGVFVTTSSSVFPQFREFERFTTAAINAFVGPKVGRYVRNLRGGLKKGGVKADVHIMRSNGGVSPSEVAAEQPVSLLLSGPAAGVQGGAWSGGLSGRKKLITFDVGGTSADIGIVTERGFAEAGARDTWIAGFPVMVPMINISTIGAGGGSIAYVDEGGAFRVGPRSAGAVPGPAAYGHGGTEPTVTDAHSVLGRLDPENFLGGNMPLYPERAREVVGELAGKLGMSEEEAAAGIITILNNNMANATHSVTTQKGHDPREFSLVAFGGAGPLHAVEVARILGVGEVIIPAYPGINSAIGLLTTDLKYDAIATQFTLSTAPDLGRLNSDLERLEREVHSQLREDGIAEEDISILRGADCRYVGQGYELRVALPEGRIDEENIGEVWERMHDLHRSEYGHAFPDNPIELVNARVSGVGRTPKIAGVPLEGERRVEAARLKEQDVGFRVDGSLESFPTAFYERDRLPVEEPVEGPAIILQKDTTTVLPPDTRATLDESGNLIVELKEA